MLVGILRRVKHKGKANKSLYYSKWNTFNENLPLWQSIFSLTIIVFDDEITPRDPKKMREGMSFKKMQIVNFRKTHGLGSSICFRKAFCFPPSNFFFKNRWWTRLCQTIGQKWVRTKVPVIKTHCEPGRYFLSTVHYIMNLKGTMLKNYYKYNWCIALFWLKVV